MFKLFTKASAYLALVRNKIKKTFAYDKT